MTNNEIPVTVLMTCCDTRYATVADTLDHECKSTESKGKAVWVIKSRRRSANGRFVNDSLYGQHQRTEDDARNFIEANGRNRFIQFIATNVETGKTIWE